ncbi:hypothetical protein ALC152_22310 [Arcobacter sp. 15-2]|uniref:hypothetical protein n=1 Tax=Arcobacter sp. 15-2 TaxID=3374109 RepID=UPI00399C829B
MKKAFEIFYEKNQNQSEKLFTEKFKRVLRSYEIQKNLGISEISAFENSLINATNAKSKKIKINELEIKNAKIKQNSPTLNKLYLFQSELNMWIQKGISMRKMRKLLWELHRFKCSHETIRKYIKMLYEEEKINKN